MLTTAGLAFPVVIGWIGGYCAIMVLPAAIATCIRVRAHDRVEPILVKLDTWFSRNGPVMSGTAFTLIGILLVGGALV